MEETDVKRSGEVGRGKRCSECYRGEREFWEGRKNVKVF